MSILIVLLLVAVLAGQHQDRIVAGYRAFRPAPVPEPEPEPEPDPQATLRAIRMAFAELGMDPNHCQPDFNVERTGKVSDVLHFAAKYLERDLPMRTVADLVVILDRLER